VYVYNDSNLTVCGCGSIYALLFIHSIIVFLWITLLIMMNVNNDDHGIMTAATPAKLHHCQFLLDDYAFDSPSLQGLKPCMS